MRLAFLKLPQSERKLYFQQAGLNRGLHPAIMEKDFWVCWLLSLLFGHPDFKEVLVFKGGTSLSKVFNVIHRFSEDIDLSVAPSFLGIAEDEVERAQSRTQRDRWMQRLEKTCAEVVQNRVQPELEVLIQSVLGKREDHRSWIEFVLDPVSQSPILLFHYPTTQGEGFAYLHRMVKMEFGSLTDQRPTAYHTIKPWIAEEILETFSDWKCEVIALELERTFWEKATILHAEYYRVATEKMPDRFSRHYADMAELARNPRSLDALEKQEILERVVNWKTRFFARAWARYDLAKPGTFRLVPPLSRLSELETDYEAMKEMYMLEPLPFAEVMDILLKMESKING